MEVSKKLTLLLGTALILAYLGKVSHPEVQIFTLNSNHLIVRQDALADGPQIEYAQSAEMDPRPVEFREKTGSRAPASITPVAAKLGGKRKVRTLIAEVSSASLVQPLPPQVVRQRPVKIDAEGLQNLLQELAPQQVAALSQEERSFNLNLFAETSYKAVIDSITPSKDGGFLVHGRLKDVSGGQFTLIHEGHVTLANIAADAKTQFEIRYSGEEQVVNQIDLNRSMAAIEPSGGAPGWQTVKAPSAGEPIRVLVAYTPELRAAQGGTAGIKALAQLAAVRAQTKLVETVELPSNDISELGQDLIAKRDELDAHQVHILTQSNTVISPIADPQSADTSPLPVEDEASP